MRCGLAAEYLIAHDPNKLCLISARWLLLPFPLAFLCSPGNQAEDAAEKENISHWFNSWVPPLKQAFVFTGLKCEHLGGGQRPPPTVDFLKLANSAFSPHRLRIPPTRTDSRSFRCFYQLLVVRKKKRGSPYVSHFRPVDRRSLLR